MVSSTIQEVRDSFYLGLLSIFLVGNSGCSSSYPASFA